MSDQEHDDDFEQDEFEVDDLDLIEEMEISISPRHEVLAARGIEIEAFEQALELALAKHEALASREDVADDEIPTLDEIPVEINGEVIMLGELASIEVNPVEDEDDDEEEDEAEDEDD